MKIVLLHGALGAADQLHPLAESLEKKGYGTVTLELPGHGNSPSDDKIFSIDSFAGWLSKKIEDQGLWDLPFFGFSMGGYVMLYLLSQKNLAVGPVITLGTKFAWNEETSAREANRLNPDKLLEKVPKFAQMLSERHNDWKKVLQNTKDLMISLGQNPLLNKDTVSGIRQQVLILRGESDQMVTEKESSEIAASLPNGQYMSLAGLPHPLEQVPVNDVTEVIYEFLQKHAKK